MEKLVFLQLVLPMTIVLQTHRKITLFKAYLGVFWSRNGIFTEVHAVISQINRKLPVTSTTSCLQTSFSTLIFDSDIYIYIFIPQKPQHKQINVYT